MKPELSKTALNVETFESEGFIGISIWTGENEGLKQRFKFKR